MPYVGYRVYRHFFHHGQRTAHHDDVEVPFEFKIKVCDTSLKGYLLLAPFEQKKVKTHGKIMILGLDGVVYYEKMLGQTAYDFRQWQLGGKVYYTYIVNDPKAQHIFGTRIPAGYAVILDSALNELKEVHLLPHGSITTNEGQGLDLHEFLMRSEDDYYVMADYKKSVHNIPDSIPSSSNIKIGAPVIQEIRDNSVVWQWDASNFPEFYGTSTEHNHYTDTTKVQDYLHINSLFIDPMDSNLICSFRCANQVVKIDRRSGKILWRLGGKNSDFVLADDQKFYRQHNVTVTEDGRKLLMLDNGDTILRKSSRILELDIDQKTRKIMSYSTFPIKDTPCLFMGNVEKEGDDYFISGGLGMVVLDYNYITGKKRFEAWLNQATYRAYKVEKIFGLEQKKTLVR